MNAATIVEQALRKNEWPLTHVDELTLLRSPLLSEIDRLEHAFTTRIGGGTPAPLDSFNLGRHWPTEESRQDAVENRRRLCAALRLDFNRLTVPGQQHTTNIYVVDTKTASHDQRLPDLDGAATDAPGFPLLLHFADCVPVMIVDPRQRVLCVMHAGWKGTASGIVRKGVQLLVNRWGSRTSDIVAAVGPAIGPCCYPTGDDVAMRLLASVEDVPELVERRDGAMHPDLKAINAMQLLQSGVNRVDVTSWCTACHPEIFYSHRQSGGKTGRQGAIACLR